MDDLYKTDSITVRAWHFDWAPGQGIPDIPGIHYHEWITQTIVSGMKKNIPIVETAFVNTPNGERPILQGDWLIQTLSGDNYVFIEMLFDLLFYPVIPENETQEPGEYSIG